MDRTALNQSTLHKCLECLRSSAYQEISEGVILASYLIEQVLKIELFELNPLLYFDRKHLDEKMEAQVANKQLLPKDLSHIPTSSAKRCLNQLSSLNPELEKHKTQLEELFRLRNLIIHSIADIPEDGSLLAEIAVNSLKCCRELLINRLGITEHDLNPLTSTEITEIEAIAYKKRAAELYERIMWHRIRFESLSSKEIQDRLKDLDHEHSGVCPACKNRSLEEDAWGDYEYLGNGEFEGGGWIQHTCRVCDLVLSQYEYDLGMWLGRKESNMGENTSE